MHPFRFAMLRGPQILRAPEDDQGSEYDDPIDDADDGDIEEPDDQDDRDEPDDDESIDEGDDDPVAPVRQPSRGENRIAALARETKAAKDRADLLERQLTDIQNRQSQPAQPTQAQIDAHLATLEPWERTEFLRQQDANRVNQTLAQMQFQQQEQMDRIAYESLKTRAPIAAKLERDVETRLAEMRRNGTTAPRETVLRWVIGDRALANAGRAAGKAQRTATANRERQAGRPGGARGDAVGSDDRRANSAAAREKRLANQVL